MPDDSAGTGGNRRNKVKTSVVKISTTPRVVQLLEALAGAGTYGKNAAEVAEEFVRDGIRRVYGDAVIAGPAPPPPAVPQ